MNNLIRSSLLLLFFGGMLFCQKDEPGKVTWEDDNRTTLLEQAFNEQALLSLKQKRMLRLKQSANDDRQL